MWMGVVEQGCKVEVDSDAVNRTSDNMTSVAVFFLLYLKYHIIYLQ
jgi:hypothetical protein